MTMSCHPYTSSPTDDFEDMIDWSNGGIYDPIFENDSSFLDLQGSGFSDGYHVPESITSEQQYTPAQPLLSDGTPSIGYTVSGPPSVLEGPSSFGHTYGVSPSFDTTATPPFGDQNNEQYFGSFGVSDNILSPLCHTSESPVLDTRFALIPDNTQSPPGSYETARDTVFNPHVTGSSNAFSGLDVRVSQVFSNVGGWADQPQIIEPIAEPEDYPMESYPIQIPQTSGSFHSDTTYPRSEGTYQHHNRSRAVTIPEATRGASSYNHSVSHSRWSHRMTPTLSVSPVAHRLARSCTLSRSTSQSRRKPATPSPTESYGWVSYQPNPLTNKLAPTSTDGMQGRTPRGRKKGLTAEQRRHAALMRIVGACTNCQRGKRKCDEGTPCKPCLEHYKGDLVNHPCRDRLLADLSDAFLSDRLGWHPTARSPESFAAPSGYTASTSITYTIPLLFGFGQALLVPVHPLQLENNRPLVHDHIVYSWPPDQSSEKSHRHAVLPAVLSTDTSFDLQQVLDAHLSKLVTHHFRAFPLYLSPLRILKEIYIFSRSISPSNPHAHTLHQALKLLVLVHIGGDITLPTPTAHPTLAQLIHTTMDSLPASETPTPCFIRAQFGAIMPTLASSLMKSVLSSLEQLYLNRDCDDWPLALAITIVILMTVESIHYHAAKLPYHNNLLSHALPTTPANEDTIRADDPAIQTLLTFYSSCFSGCHARLQPEWDGESDAATLRRGHQVSSPENTFVESVRRAVGEAGRQGYLARKAYEVRGEGGMGWFFDRLVARLVGGRG
ncbi:hypothetical protein T440DRAFT_514559 [Plenodomus tracheiphilus IPT5]|uniref:Zn(2)-C6 fungal-type domain-containing protein n=1 Tax=Plenodomus tracheiphilus IPT5 TaxID=1408161 RepID=A0A6A7BGX9_9PLEO|nr:hypothetical protein T440DRAFT_514559 [Plenodomus tracheiphilus IPT5]